MLFFALVILFAKGFCDDKPQCWRGGKFNETTKTCDCPWGWENLQNPGGICQSKSCGTGLGPFLEDECKCDDHFTGLDCEICLDDDGCVEVYGDDYSCSKQTLKSFKNLNTDCNVHEDYMIALIGSMVTFQMDGIGSGKETGFPNVAYMQAWSFNSTTNFEGETFWCNLYNCTMSELPNDGIKYECIKSYCGCNDGLTGNKRCLTEPEIRQVVANMRGSCHVQCQNDGKCQFKHSDFPATVLMSCSGAECIKS